ncbi:hypothetical protein KSF_107810 [Reticulibacter mediterranei]|uniref:Uncharacterized protein n=1 Tax=Reticulibacter mediterranei TaxID=2778369 RepID=A0A8J3N9F7_9CHLR|nr:hypothetical protein KSF_107810 [Reticulibacter mediterranei]
MEGMNMLYKIYIYDVLEYICAAPSAERACEMTSDVTKEDWNEIHAVKLQLPQGVSLETLYPPNRYPYLNMDGTM